jgi:Fe-S-cluster-containing dehydrogenase component
MGGKIMKRYVILVDVEKCTFCYNCVLACKDEHTWSDRMPVAASQQELEQHWIKMHEEERGSGSKVCMTCYPVTCRHCVQPDCEKASPAVYKRDDGIVIIDPVKAKGEKSLLKACPYGSITWNKELELPQKCTFCAHLLDAGELVPRCVEACPVGALIFGDANDPNSEVSKLLKEHPEQAAETSGLRYINMPGKFIAGSVYLSETEVAKGAEVQLLDGDTLVAKTQTNGFGDFKFDNLPDNMRYQIKISLEGFKPLTLIADTAKDVCWEEIMFA